MIPKHWKEKRKAQWVQCLVQCLVFPVKFVVKTESIGSYLARLLAELKLLA